MILAGLGRGKMVGLGESGKQIVHSSERGGWGEHRAAGWEQAGGV